METFDVEDRWPELFVQLDATQRNAVRQSLAAGWHEGFEPTREDVENVTDLARSAIDVDEYRRRGHAAARPSCCAVTWRSPRPTTRSTCVLSTGICSRTSTSGLGSIARSI